MTHIDEQTAALPSSPVSDLVERVRGVAGWLTNFGGRTTDGHASTCTEAASTITTLTAENERLRDKWQKATWHNETTAAFLKVADERVKELDGGLLLIQTWAVASAACDTAAQLDNILTRIANTARRVREGGKAE